MPPASTRLSHRLWAHWTSPQRAVIHPVKPPCNALPPPCRGPKCSAPKGGKGAAYIKVSEAEIADDYPAPPPYNKEEVSDPLTG